MAQFGRPDQQITNTGNGLFSDIDEASPSDADFWFGDNNAADEFEVGLSNVSDPSSSAGHTFRYRIAKTNAGTVDGTGNAVTVTARLMQGTTQIATDTARTADGTWTQYELTLSGAEADAITDYTDLRLEFLTSASGGSPANRRGGAVSWAELEVPEAGAGETPTPGGGIAGGTSPAPRVDAAIAGAPAGGPSPSPQTSLTIAGALSAGTAPVAQVSVVSGGATAGGFAPPEPVIETPAAGGAVATGLAPLPATSPSSGGAQASGIAPVVTTILTSAGAVAIGLSPSAFALVSVGGSVAGGVAPSEGGGTTETPTPGGASAGGVGAHAVVLVATGGASAGGVAPTDSNVVISTRNFDFPDPTQTAFDPPIPIGQM